MENYKGLKSNFTKISTHKLPGDKELVLSIKTNPVTKEETISLAQSMTVTGPNGKPMKIFLKNAVNIDKNIAKEIAFNILKNV